MIDNKDAYLDLEWIIEESDSGFFLLVASSAMQEKILSRYPDSNIRVFNYQDHPDNYSFGQLLPWIEEAADKICIIQNMQLALSSDEACSRLNLLRDALHRLNTNIIFCMASYAEERLNRVALDLYSYVKLVLQFEDEEDITERKPQIELRATDESENIAPPEIDLNGDPQYWLSRALSLNNQTKVFLDAGRYQDALTLLNAILIIREHYLPENHPDIADTYEFISIAFEGLGRYDEAMEYCKKALEFCEARLGLEHLLTADAYSNIARVYREMGQLDIALQYSKKALAISEVKLGSEHPDTAIAYNNIANAYYAMGKYDTALEYHRKALAIYEDKLGAEHPDTAATYDNIANVYYDMGKLDTALEYHKKALAICESKLGAEHPDTATTYNNVAFVYWKKGDLKTAQIYFEKALTIYQNKLGKDHPYTKETQQALEILEKKIQ